MVAHQTFLYAVIMVREGPYYSWLVCVSVRSYVCEQLSSEMAEGIRTKFHPNTKQVVQM